MDDIVELSRGEEIEVHYGFGLHGILGIYADSGSVLVYDLVRRLGSARRADLAVVPYLGGLVVPAAELTIASSPTEFEVLNDAGMPAFGLAALERGLCLRSCEQNLRVVSW